MVHTSSDPSFDYCDADVILRSSGSLPSDFRLHKCILSMSSPFFASMFSLPQPPVSSSCKDELPIIEAAEDAPVLNALFKFIYPVPDPSITSLDELVPVLTAAAKYEMTSALDRMRYILVAPQFLASSPVRVYAIASRFELEDEARLASRHSLGMTILDGPLCDDLKHITAYAYHRLLNLHRTRATAAQSVLAEADASGERVRCMQCNGAQFNSTRSYATPKWWSEWRSRAKEEVGRRPTTEVVFGLQFLMEAARESACPRCAMSVLDSYAFLDGLKAKMDALPATI
ncbi:hypothetical protein OF83DRAFT_723950 [Amylostereum chailletii]|nr:hypothetical protein OF83DRAFT_723950 [Amylostereum chailletii]